MGEWGNELAGKKVGKFFKLRKEHVSRSRVEDGTFREPEIITGRDSPHLFKSQILHISKTKGINTFNDLQFGEPSISSGETLPLSNFIRTRHQQTRDRCEEHKNTCETSVASHK